MAPHRQTNAPDLLEGELRIAVSQTGDATTIELEGEWDLATQLATRQAIGRALSGQPESLVLDLSRISFVDSSGVHAVVGLARRSQRLGIRLLIVPGPKAVQRIFELCQLTRHLPFTEATWPG
jgi:anti-sigma B factor antagonist